MILTAIRLAALCILASFSVPCTARPVAPDPASVSGDYISEEASLPYIQCVPYARQVSGILLYGDAHTWWSQAAGHYARGGRPKVGAVMAFRPYGAMQLGHVAAVSRVIDSRTVLLRHANWSPIDGRRGQLEDNVRAVDVSPANDWSEVRVWYAPLGGLGTTHWPVSGFIYNHKPAADERLTVLASADGPATKPAYTSRIGSDFLKGVVLDKTLTPTTARRQLAMHEMPVRPAKASPKDDPIGRIIVSRMR